MLQNVEHTTETIGTLRESKAMFNGQENTHEYTDAERAQLVGGPRPKTFGMEWMDQPVEKVETMISTIKEGE